MDLSITRASFEEKPVIERLLQLCLCEDQARDAEVGVDSSQVYPWFDYYWSSPRRHPYLLRVTGGATGDAVGAHETHESHENETAWQRKF